MQLAFQFGSPAAAIEPCPQGFRIALANEAIWGCSREVWANDLPAPQRAGALTLWPAAHALWGAGLIDVADRSLEEAAQTLYDVVFAASRGLHLHRIWNYIPAINDSRDGLDNYQAFCKGRASAFDACFGEVLEPWMPAASALGTPGRQLCVVFVARREPVRHIENPQQVPAYRYPTRYGPRSPSFARGSLVECAGRTRLYVSGTASIRGSDSLHPGDVSAQCAVTLENLDLVARAAGVPGIGDPQPANRRFRIYLRHKEHWPRIRGQLEPLLQGPHHAATVVQAEVCRQELLVEVEACIDVDHR